MASERQAQPIDSSNRPPAFLDAGEEQALRYVNRTRVAGMTAPREAGLADFSDGSFDAYEAAVAMPDGNTMLLGGIRAGIFSDGFESGDLSGFAAPVDVTESGLRSEIFILNLVRDDPAGGLDDGQVSDERPNDLDGFDF